MGQRLVINIYSKGEILANAYYHWSAYSLGSLDELRPIIKELETPEEQEYKFGVLDAIKLLQVTSAELTDKEFDEIKKLYPSFKRKTERIDRNDGLIAFTEKGKSTNMLWSEGIIEVFVDDKTFDFSIVFPVESREKLKEFYQLDELDMPDEFGSPFYSFELIPFDRFEEFYSFVETVIRGEGVVRFPDGSFAVFVY